MADEVKTQHTPGPWGVEGKFPHPAGLASGVKGGGKWIAKVHPLDGGDDVVEAEANAKLIAAAPNLLQTIRDLISTLEMAGDDLEELGRPRAAKSCRFRADAAQRFIDEVVSG